MVSGKDDAVCFSDGYPTGSLKGLCCLVDKECGKSPAGQDTVVTADQCGSDDPCPENRSSLICISSSVARSLR